MLRQIFTVAIAAINVMLFFIYTLLVNLLLVLSVVAILWLSSTSAPHDLLLLSKMLSYIFAYVAMLIVTLVSLNKKFRKRIYFKLQ